MAFKASYKKSKVKKGDNVSFGTGIKQLKIRKNTNYNLKIRDGKLVLILGEKVNHG